ncbi:hypothetical protein [Desulfosporosinus shakirovi]|uniref:hypothetical protein n=1 Tax=Desulfosporosinus shakirovi TaxID=2885154 RepID=UPI001E33FBD6|nr:hypothetical protein [Desulfosporosinus sp. SRJS8]MCB8815309.1 hypothetical protein [Desulfosporosinus sp. SRJS8]
MIKYYRYKEKDEVLYSYCKDEGVDYLYLLYELRNAERMNGFYAKVLRKLITGLGKRFCSDGLKPKT